MIRMGNVIPFDGEVVTGEGMVNQASLTGESLPVRRSVGQSVFAGTVLEEGEIEVLVKAVSGSTRFEKIVTMIEDSEKLKSSVEGKAEHLADRLVPYTLLRDRCSLAPDKKYYEDTVCFDGRFLLCIEACNADHCTYLQSVRQARYNITVKGGKYLRGRGRCRYNCLR